MALDSWVAGTALPLNRASFSAPHPDDRDSSRRRVAGEDDDCDGGHRDDDLLKDTEPTHCNFPFIDY